MKWLRLDRIKTAFWIIYLLIPISTGFLESHRSSQEYDENKHVLIKAHPEECGPEGLQSCEVADRWRNKTTGEEFTASQVDVHGNSEAIHTSITAFMYGMIGCLFFAVTNAIQKRTSTIQLFADTNTNIDQEYLRCSTKDFFFNSLKWAIAVNLTFSIVIYIAT